MNFKKLVIPAIALIVPFVMPLEAQQYQSDSSQEAATVPLVQAGNNGKLGKILTDSRGMTLYEYKGDSENKSACYDQCSVDWPPFTLHSGQPQPSADLPGKLTLVNRDENSRQIAYNGKPLYFYKGDKKPGDANGQGVDSKWFAIPVSGLNR